MWTVISIIIACFLLIYINFFIVIVVGNSMQPSMKDGEIHFCRRFIFSKKKRDLHKYIGRVFVFYPPYVYDEPNHFVIKRLTKISNDKCFFEGDNKKDGESYDSRHFGFVSTDKIVGYLIRKVTLK